MEQDGENKEVEDSKPSEDSKVEETETPESFDVMISPEELMKRRAAYNERIKNDPDANKPVYEILGITEKDWHDDQMFAKNIFMESQYDGAVCSSDIVQKIVARECSETRKVLLTLDLGRNIGRSLSEGIGGEGLQGLLGLLASRAKSGKGHRPQAPDNSEVGDPPTSDIPMYF